MLTQVKAVLGLGLLGWWQKGRQGQIPRSDAWGMGDGVARELRCLGMQQSSIGVVGLKARMLIDQSIPIIDAA